MNLTFPAASDTTIRSTNEEALGTTVMHRSVRLGLPAWLWLVAVGTAILAGCGGDSALTSPTAERMKGLANAYLDQVVGGEWSPHRRSLV